MCGVGVHATSRMSLVGVSSCHRLCPGDWAQVVRFDDKNLYLCVYVCVCMHVREQFLRLSLCSPGWPAAHYVDKPGLKVTEIWLFLLSEDWDERHSHHNWLQGLYFLTSSSHLEIVLEIFIKNEMGTWVWSQFSSKSSKHPFNNQVKLISSFKSENQSCVFRKEDKTLASWQCGLMEGSLSILFLPQLQSLYSEPW